MLLLKTKKTALQSRVCVKSLRSPFGSLVQSFNSYFFLLQVHRYPVIKSGDQIVLRSAYSSYSSYLLYCSTSYCNLAQCSGSQSMTKSLWSSCSSLSKFYITAFGRVNGEPINSGDTVSLSSVAYGSSYRLRCTSSNTWYCRVQS